MLAVTSRGATPLDAWRVFAPKVQGQAIEGGHFLPEEAPEALVSALLPFLAPTD